MPKVCLFSATSEPNKYLIILSLDRYLASICKSCIQKGKLVNPVKTKALLKSMSGLLAPMTTELFNGTVVEIMTELTIESKGSITSLLVLLYD